MERLNRTELDKIATPIVDSVEKNNKENAVLEIARLADNFIITRFEGDPSNEILDQVYRLRSEVFVNELGWVLSKEDEEKEKDKYDANAVHFVALQKDSEKVAGYLRLIRPEDSFMFENEFRDLLSKFDLETLKSRKLESVEISRLVLRKDLRGGFTGLSLNMSLYKEMYRWSLENKNRYLYMVTTQKLLRSIQRFFPCTPIGVSKKYQKEHDEAIAAVIDIRDAENKSKKENPKFFEWFFKVGIK